MSNKIVCVKGIRLKLYAKSFSVHTKIGDKTFGSKIVFPQTINEETMISLVTAIYDIVEEKAIENAKEKVATWFYEAVKGIKP
jgi:hypothetical protein